MLGDGVLDGIVTLEHGPAHVLANKFTGILVEDVLLGGIVECWSNTCAGSTVAQGFEILCGSRSIAQHHIGLGGNHIHLSGTHDGHVAVARLIIVDTHGTIINPVELDERREQFVGIGSHGARLPLLAAVVAVGIKQVVDVHHEPLVLFLLLVGELALGQPDEDTVFVGGEGLLDDKGILGGYDVLVATLLIDTSGHILLADGAFYLLHGHIRINLGIGKIFIHAITLQRC